ncbi:MAG TPA: dinitrogenase iron-molybdenum cofactor biosynthesis protein [Polyangiales bacterium]
MEQAPFSNEVALRIGLAARVLPNVSVVDLIEALENLSPDAIDEAALSRITVTQLKASFHQSHDVDGDEENEADFRGQDIAAFKEAVRILWGETNEAEKLPDLAAYQEGDMPGSIRVAIASNSQEQLDGHFGSCLRYLVYQVSADEVRLIDARPTLAADLSSDKNAFRVNLIRDCKVLYVVSAGGPAAAKVIKADIHLIQIAEGGAARDIVGKLQDVMRGRPPPWLAKVMGTSVADRVRYRSMGD